LWSGLDQRRSGEGFFGPENTERILAGAGYGCSELSAQAGGDGAGAVLDWNAVMQATLSQVPDPFLQVRSATITQVAVCSRPSTRSSATTSPTWEA
jgi:hypothetical protein